MMLLLKQEAYPPQHHLVQKNKSLIRRFIFGRLSGKGDPKIKKLEAILLGIEEAKGHSKVKLFRSE